jgi:hypothetical protein
MKTSILVLIGAAMPVGICVAGGGLLRDRTDRILSVCDLFEDLRRYDAKVITVTGLVYDAPSYTIGETGCAKKFVTRGFKWPTIITLETSLGEFEGRAVPFRTSHEILRGIDDAIGKRARGEEIRITVTGQLRLKRRYELAHTGYGVLGTGYGHLGASPAVLLLRSIDSVETQR